MGNNDALQTLFFDGLYSFTMIGHAEEVLFKIYLKLSSQYCPSYSNNALHEKGKPKIPFGSPVFPFLDLPKSSLAPIFLHTCTTNTWFASLESMCL